MFDPFAYHRRLVAAALSMTTIAQRSSEMASASHHVIAKRSEMMAAAARSPIDGNYAELARMVPEKLDAFTRAGAAVASDWWAIQMSLIDEARHFGALAMKGRAPTFAELSASASRTAEFLLWTFERMSAIGGAGLHPIHATVTANAKRLKHASRPARR